MFVKMNMVSLIIASLLLTINSSAQIIKHYGLKGGISNAWQSFVLDDDKVQYSNNRVGMNFGVYADWVDIPYFTLTTEVDYIVKGMKDEVGIDNSIKEECRLGYISFIILPNLFTEISNIKISGFAGPRLDILVDKSYTVVGADYLNNWLRERVEGYEDIQLGITLGLGFEVKNHFPFIIGLESRYSPDFSKVYSVPLYFIKNNSLEILLKLGI